MILAVINPRMLSVCRIHCLKKAKGISSMPFNVGRAYFSSEQKQTVPVVEEVLIYEGKYNKRMKWLRKVSFTSAVMGTLFMPLSIVLESGVIPIVAQAGVMGCLCLFSASSTAILQVVGHPYVGSLYEQIPPLPANESSNGQPIRRFKASKYNFLGQQKFTEFVLSDVSKKPRSPFASCRIEKAKADFYVFGGPSLKDDDIRNYMTREGVVGAPATAPVEGAVVADVSSDAKK